ncbi:TonB-dependent siderophore receptor [Rheinheimera oceanensis]|uniref:TonB-dependent siderophore receptor n=1 Tax=Rheinheimera oceanensis TaxID=2817449 RepID=UPI001BFDC2C2|nr:TonB-dependent siderophore receptor [Rheinheimera oceanensis]
MEKLTTTWKFRWSINRYVEPAVYPHLDGANKRTARSTPRTVLGSALAAAVLISAQSAFAAESEQNQTKAGETSQEDTALPTTTVTNNMETITVTGHRETATTEGTGSYTTGETAAAIRLPLSLRETPQSVTVITRQRMDDQQLNSVKDVLENSTGISSNTNDSERVSFYSRGFQIDSFQYDSIPTAYFEGTSFLNTAFYDRIEIVRGATGLLSGAGNPSASVNLVRKRPTRRLSASASVSAGSWDNYRGTADISTPLTEDGSIRARLVGVHQERDSFIDRYEQNKDAFYGIIEAALTPDTTLSLGYDYQDIRADGTTWGGIPIWFSDGSEANWSRSKSLAADWSGWDNSLKTTFSSLEHHFDNDWTARAVFTHQETDSNAKLFSGSGTPDRVTGGGLFPVGLASDTATRQNSFDAMTSGPFQLFGRQHELVVGVMGSKRTSNQNSTGFIFGLTPMGSIYDWNGNYPELDFAAAGYTPTDITTKQSGAYSAARFSLTEPLKLIIGGRFSNYEIDQDTNGVRFHYEKTGEFTPYAGLVYDINETYSAYISYTEIFNPQTYRDRDGNVLKPTTGKNKEVGLKGEYLNGRLNASVSLFEARLDNLGQTDPGQILPDGTQAYYGASGTKSRGIDVDLQGELTQDWNLYAGVSHFSGADSSDARLSSQLPRTTARLFTTYRLPDTWNKLTVGGGVSWQSRFYQSATSPLGAVTAEQKPYGLVSLMTHYAATDKVELAVNVNNLFDKKYTVMNGFFNQMLYGEPRNVMATVSVKY